ncbi:MAG: DUF2959 family protein [Puniceicoccaceae bacterium]
MLRTNSILASILVVFLIGCTTGGSSTRRVAQTATSLDRLKAAMIEGSEVLSVSLSNLTALAFSSPEEVEKALDRYSKSISKLNEGANRIRSRADTVDRQKERHFEMWEAEIAAMKSAQIAGMSEGRRRVVIEKFEAVRESLNQTRDNYVPFAAVLQDIEVAVSLDPSLTVLEELQARLPEITAQGSQLSSAINGSIEAINQAKLLWNRR